jgi:hypothetical protein
MSTLLDRSDIDTTANDVREAVQRLADLALHWEPLRTVAAVSHLLSIRYIVADAVMDAFPRAVTTVQRNLLIQVIDGTCPPEDDPTLEFLDQVAAEDPDADVARYAAEVRKKMDRLQGIDDALWLCTPQVGAAPS